MGPVGNDRLQAVAKNTAQTRHEPIRGGPP
jgi:hypothetical protein